MRRRKPTLFEISVIDLKTGRLVWFSDNFHKFSALPNQEKQEEKGLALFQVILKNFKKSLALKL